MSFRTGYQVNIGRREAGEFIGIVVHRKAPGAIRGNVLWLDRGDDKFPGLRKKEDWNHLRDQREGTAAAPSVERHEDLRREGRPDRSRGSQMEGGRSDQSAVAAGRRVGWFCRLCGVPERSNSRALTGPWSVVRGRRPDDRTRTRTTDHGCRLCRTHAIAMGSIR